MSKLPVISGKEAIKALVRAGFVATRQRGSHVRMEKAASEKTMKITVPLHDTLDRGTLKSILRSAGITAEEFSSPSEDSGFTRTRYCFSTR